MIGYITAVVIPCVVSLALGFGLGMLYENKLDEVQHKRDERRNRWTHNGN